MLREIIDTYDSYESEGVFLEYYKENKNYKYLKEKYSTESGIALQFLKLTKGKQQLFFDKENEQVLLYSKNTITKGNILEVAEIIAEKM